MESGACESALLGRDTEASSEEAASSDDARVLLVAQRAIGEVTQLAVGTYRIACPDSTVLDLLVFFAHSALPTSSSACLRHHPHDDHVEFHMTTEELLEAWRAATAKLDAIKIVPAPWLAAGSVGMSCSPLELANAVRRSLLTRLESVALVEVDIVFNSSAYEDEQVAMRFGALPIVRSSSARGGRATVCAQGRDLLGEDVTFDDGSLTIAAAFLKTRLVELSAGESFVAELKCEAGTPLAGHAKFDSVATPTYAPEVRLRRNPSREERAALTPLYIIDRQRYVHARDPKMPVRVEALQERAPNIPLEPATRATVGVESLGGRAARDCARGALRALRTEMALVVQKITAFDRVGQPEVVFPRAFAGVGFATAPSAS